MNLNLDEVVYISIIIHIAASSVNLLNGYDIIFFLMGDTKNQIKTKFQSSSSIVKGTLRKVALRGHLIKIM